MEKERIWEIDCRLKEEEIREALLAGRPDKGRKWMAKGLGIVGLLMLGLYALHPENLAYSLLAVLAAAEMALVLSQPLRQAKKTAKKLNGRRFRIRYSEAGWLSAGEGEKVRLNESQSLTAAETDALFALWPKGQPVFILPKRCLQPELCGQLRSALGDALKRSSVSGEGRGC